MYKIVCVGKIKEQYLADAINEYVKRIKGFQKINIIEVKEINTKDVKFNLKEEGKNILANINQDEYVITLEILGKILDSVEIAKKIEQVQTYGKSVITFVIGGSNGLDEEVKKRSDFAWSFSKLTFPHQLMRVMLVEQIYRLLTINNNKEYHK